MLSEKKENGFDFISDGCVSMPSSEDSFCLAVHIVLRCSIGVNVNGRCATPAFRFNLIWAPKNCRDLRESHDDQRQWVCTWEAASLGRMRMVGGLLAPLWVWSFICRDSRGLWVADAAYGAQQEAAWTRLPVTHDDTRFDVQWLRTDLPGLTRSGSWRRASFRKRSKMMIVSRSCKKPASEENLQP